MLRNMSNVLSHFKTIWFYWIMLIANGMLMIFILFTIAYEIYAISMLIKKNIPLPLTLDMANTYQNQKKSSIADWHLFGKMASPVRSNTKWMLRGIVMGDDAKDNEAILASTDADEDIYGVGSKLPDGSIILNIDTDRVVLSHDSIIENLYLSWDADEMTQSRQSD